MVRKRDLPLDRPCKSLRRDGDAPIVASRKGSVLSSEQFVKKTSGLHSPRGNPASLHHILADGDGDGLVPMLNNAS